MTEKQTNRQDPDEVVYNFDGQLIDDKGRTEDEIDFDNPFVRTPEERAAATKRAKDEAAAGEDFTPQAARRAQRFTGRQIAKGAVVGAAVVGGIAAGVAGLSSLEAGNSNGAERGEVAADIYSLTLAPDANLRYDPNMGDVNTNTFIGQPGQETVVVGQSRIRVLEGTNNGTWYGLSSDWLADAIPNFNDGNDKDGIIWVNEQGVTHVTHLEDVNIQLPDTPAYEDDSSEQTNP